MNKFHTLEQKLIGALKEIGVGQSNSHRRELLIHLNVQGRFILYFNSMVDLWKSNLGESVQDLTDTKTEGPKRPGMSIERMVWFLLSHTYVVSELLKIPVTASMAHNFAPPLSDQPIQKRALPFAVEQRLITKTKLESDGTIHIVRLTDVGRSKVLDYFEELTTDLGSLIGPPNSAEQS